MLLLLYGCFLSGETLTFVLLGQVIIAALKLLREAVCKVLKKKDIMWWPNEHFDNSYYFSLEMAEKKPKAWLHCDPFSMS